MLPFLTRCVLGKAALYIDVGKYLTPVLEFFAISQGVPRPCAAVPALDGGSITGMYSGSYWKVPSLASDVNFSMRFFCFWNIFPPFDLGGMAMA